VLTEYIIPGFPKESHWQRGRNWADPVDQPIAQCQPWQVFASIPPCRIGREIDRNSPPLLVTSFFKRIYGKSLSSKPLKPVSASHVAFSEHMP
jgi:hypothetical protein